MQKNKPTFERKRTIRYKPEFVKKVKALSSTKYIREIAEALEVSYSLVMVIQNDPANGIENPLRDTRYGRTYKADHNPPAKGCFDHNDFNGII